MYSEKRSVWDFELTTEKTENVGGVYLLHLLGQNISRKFFCFHGLRFAVHRREQT